MKRAHTNPKRTHIMEKTEGGFGFFQAIMPDSRKADLQLGCLDGSVFIDFNLTENNLIYLQRISFDSFGCCRMGDDSPRLNSLRSSEFLNELRKETLDQKKIESHVLEMIRLNKNNIWRDALVRYGFIEKKKSMWPWQRFVLRSSK